MKVNGKDYSQYIVEKSKMFETTNQLVTELSRRPQILNQMDGLRLWPDEIVVVQITSASCGVTGVENLGPQV